MTRAIIRQWFDDHDSAHYFGRFPEDSEACDPSCADELATRLGLTEDVKSPLLCEHAGGWRRRLPDDSTWCLDCGRWRDDIMREKGYPPSEAEAQLVVNRRDRQRLLDRLRKPWPDTNLCASPGCHRAAPNGLCRRHSPNTGLRRA